MIPYLVSVGLNPTTSWPRIHNPCPQGGVETSKTSTPTDVFNENNALGTIAGAVVTALDSLMPGRRQPQAQRRAALDTVCVDNCSFISCPTCSRRTRTAPTMRFKRSPEVHRQRGRAHPQPLGRACLSDGRPRCADGTHMATGETVSDGVYTCTVTALTRRLEGTFLSDSSRNFMVSGTGRPPIDPRRT